MEIVLFTIAGITLYLGSDWILNRVEEKRGERFQNRSVIFFVIILAFSLVLFQLTQHFLQK